MDGVILDTRKLTIAVNIERNYGKHKISFSMSESVTVANGAERREAYNNIVGQLEDQIRLYEHVNLGNLQLPQDNNGGAPQTNNVLEKFKVTALVVESKNGKRYVSVQGGKYAKYGVAVYEECITDLPIETYEYGVHDLTAHDLTATVDIVDGKARRTVSIQ